MCDQVRGVGSVIFMAVAHPWSQQIGPSPPLIVVLFQARINKIEKFQIIFNNLINDAHFLISSQPGILKVKNCVLAEMNATYPWKGNNAREFLN